MRRALLVLVLAVAAAGCGQVEKQDAHRAQKVDRSPPEVIAMPEDFGNLSLKCDGHGHRVYVTSNPGKSAANVFVIEDSTCPGGAPK